MESTFRNSSIPSGTHSILGDKDSKFSELSTSTASVTLKRLLDFSQSSLPGLYRVVPKYFVLEYCESDAIACSKFHTSASPFSAHFREDPFQSFGIHYCGSVDLFFESSKQLHVRIPGFRSYDPAGDPGKQYINSKQFLLIVKLVALEVRAATLGVREKRIEKIRKCIESVSEGPKTCKIIWQWMHLQVKLACFRRTRPPEFFEFIMNKVLTDEFELGTKDGCKEYLEKCFRGGEVRLPTEYYRAVLKNERKLPFDVKVLFSECQGKENKEEKAASAVLNVLPRMIGGMNYVSEGRNFNKMIADCERLCKLYEHNLIQNKCKVM
jgi:hypothetical protein